MPDGSQSVTLTLVMIYDQLVRIADALEAANANDPVAMIAKAMETEQVDPLAHVPPEERYRFG